MTVTQAGLMMLPSSIVMLLAGPFGGVLGNRIGFRQVLGLGALLCALSFALLAVAHDRVWQLLASNVLLGPRDLLRLRVDDHPRRGLGRSARRRHRDGHQHGDADGGGAFGSAFVTALLTAELIPAAGCRPKAPTRRPSPSRR
jgi:MFS family permease